MAVEVGSAYVSIIPSFKGFGEKLATGIKEQTSGLGEQVGQSIGAKIGAGMSSGGASAAAFGKKLTTHLTLPILGIGAASFKVFGDFDATMRQVGVQTDQSGKSLNDMTDLAMQMGRDTSFSAGEAATAMLELAKGGMSAAQIKGGALAETLTLAAAGSMDLGEAASTMSDTLNTFGLKASDSAKVAAALAGGANASSASVRSLAEGLGQVGPVARSAGLGVNDTVAALALFANNGIKGSDAGTSLKTMLTRLVPATKEAAKKMKDLGLDFTDAKGHIKPLSDVAQQLHDKLGPLSDKQRITAMSTIFGSDATRAATVLMNAGAAGVKKMTAKTKDLSAAHKLAKVNTEGAKGAIEQMRGSMETAGISIGRTIAPAVIGIAKHVTDLANRFTKMDPATRGFILGALGIAAALGPIIVVVGKVVGSLGTIVTEGPKVIKAFRAIGAAMAANPIGLVVAALALLVVGFIYAWQHSQTFREIMTTVFAFVASFVLKQVGTILGAIAKIFEIASKIPGPWQASMKSVAHAIRGAQDQLADWNSDVQKMPKIIKLQGDITDLDAKLKTAKAALKDPNLTKERKAVLTAEITQLLADKKRAQYAIDTLKGKTVQLSILATFTGTPAAIAAAHGRAVGGPVKAGTAYMVGERGAELFIPKQNGSIVSARDLKAASRASSAFPAADALDSRSGSTDRRSITGPLIGTAVLHEQVDVDMLARRLDFALSGASLGTGVTR